MTGDRTILAREATVGSAMLPDPKVWTAEITVSDARAVFENDHVHAILVVEHDRLVAVVERGDLVGTSGHVLVAEVGRLEGRTIRPGVDLASVRTSMITGRRRRLAVTDGRGTLLGLLCLKRSHRGFCDEDDVAARAAERAAAG